MTSPRFPSTGQALGPGILCMSYQTRVFVKVHNRHAVIPASTVATIVRVAISNWLYPLDQWDNVESHASASGSEEYCGNAMRDAADPVLCSPYPVIQITVQAIRKLVRKLSLGFRKCRQTAHNQRLAGLHGQWYGSTKDLKQDRAILRQQLIVRLTLTSLSRTTLVLTN